MSLFTLAESIQSFIDKEKKQTPESIYKTLLSNAHLSFLREMVAPKNFPVLVFCAYQIYKGNRDPQILNEIQNNLYFFNLLEFGSSENDIDCGRCDGSGHLSCDYCDGNGDVKCSDCDGDGEESCSDCDGDGEDDEGDTCSNCQGKGNVSCNNCDGDGMVNCEECSGTGTEPCDNCNGGGTITIYDAIPAEIKIFTSYNQRLKKIVEISVLQNTPDPTKEYFNEDTLLLHIVDADPQSYDASQTDSSFENQEQFGELFEVDEALVEYKTRNGGFKVIIDDLTDVPSRFM